VTFYRTATCVGSLAGVKLIHGSLDDTIAIASDYLAGRCRRLAGKEGEVSQHGFG
jgi:hypothetical protein